MRPDLDTSKIALIYPRQSTGLQVRENIGSTENQLKLAETAAADGFSQVLIIDDDLGVSAQTIDGRAGMLRALEMIKAGKVGALYAIAPNRLSRDPDNEDQSKIKKALRKAQVPLYTVSNGWVDFTKREQRLTYTLVTAIDAEMWAAHMEKLLQDKVALAARGRCVGPAPRGYRVNRSVPKDDPRYGRLVVDREAAKVVRRVVDEFLGMGAHASLRMVWMRLRHLTWPDGAWLSMKSVVYILRSPIYRGTYAWGDVIASDSHEALITADEAAKIDQRIGENRTTKRRVAEFGTEMVGLVWCPDCQRPLKSTVMHQRPRYRCDRHSSKVDGPGYHFAVAAEQIDRLVREDLFKQVTGGLVQRVIAAESTARRAKDRTAEYVREEIERLQASKAKWMDRLGREDDEELASDYRAEVKKINARMKELQAQEPITRPAAGRAAELQGLDPRAIALLPRLWSEHDLTWRRRFMRLFIARVELALIDRSMGHRKLVLQITITYHSGEASSFTLRFSGGNYDVA